MVLQFTGLVDGGTDRCLQFLEVLGLGGARFRGYLGWICYLFKLIESLETKILELWV